MKKTKYCFGLFLSLLVLVLLFAGCKDTQTEPQVTETEPFTEVVTEPAEVLTYKYTVTVQDSAGGAVQNAIIALYDENGNRVGDYTATNVAGKAFFEGCPEPNGYSAEVIAVPVSYQMFSEKVSFSKDSQSLNIVLEQDCSGYVCKIGETPYFTLSEAITAANAAEENVTITMMGNAYVTSCRVENALGKSITIDGNGYHIVTSGKDNSFDIHQTGGTVYFKNVTIFHNGTNALVRTRNAIGLNLTDVKIYATENVTDAFEFYMFNISGSGTSYVNMTRVSAEVRNSHTADKKAALIRTGVDSKVKKTVHLTMNGCNINLTRAVGRSAIMIMGQTTAEIQLNDTKILTSNAYAIRPNGQSLTITGGTIQASASPYQAEPIEGCNAKIGNNYYSLEKALTIANEGTEDTTVQLIGDIALDKTLNFTGENDTNLVLDGDGHTVTTSGGNHAVVVKKAAGSLRLQNINFEHQATRLLLRVDSDIAVDLTDVKVNATSDSNKDGLIRLLGNSTLNLTNVAMTMAHENAAPVDTATAESDEGIIRAEGKKTVSINLIGCQIDLTNAPNRTGIVIGNNVVATIKLENSAIATKDHYAIRPNGQALTLTGCELSSLDEGYNAGPIEGYVAKLGENLYTLEEALTIANAATEDVTIQLIGDVSVNKTLNIQGESGNTIVLDGAGHTITTTGGNHAIVVDKKAGSVTLQDLHIEHQASRLVLRVSTDICVNVENVTVNASSDSNKDGLFRVYGDTTLNLTGVDITMVHESAAPVDTTTAESDEGVIRAEGNNTVSITLNDCNIDLTGASNRTGIVIGNNTKATITLTNTTIATKDHYAIRPNGQVLNMDGCTLSSLDAGYHAGPVEGYVAKIGENLYTLEEALAVANGATEDVTITLCGNVTLSSTLTFTAGNDNNIVLDGNGYTVTTTGGNHMIVVKKTAGTFTVQNWNVEHQATRLVLRVDSDITVNLKDVKIHATSDSNKDGLIRLLGNSKLNLANADITMKHESTAPVDTTTAESDEGVIRAEGKKTVSISLTDCAIDLTGASNRTGIVIGNNVVADISLTNTTIATKDHYAIRPNGQALEMVGCKITSQSDTYQGNPIEGCAAKVNDIWYSSFSAAAAAADDSTEAVTVTLYADVSACTTVTLDGSNDITIDGNGYTYHSYATDTQNNHVFVVKKTAGSTLIQNLHIDHQAKKYVIRIDTAATVSLTDVTIVANNIATDAYKESLIRFHNWDSGATLNLTRVSMILQAASTGNTDSSQCFSGAITTGDNSSSKKKTVNINMVDSQIDVTGASGRAGICVSFGVTANITMENSSIAANNEYAILARQNNAKTVNAVAKIVMDAASSLTANDNAYCNEALNGLSAGGRGTVEISAPEGENYESV